MDLGLKGRRALVTGGSAGIGLATARVLRAEGADVAIVGRDRERLARAAASLATAGGGRIVALAGDCANPTDIARVVAEAIAALGPIEILVNNAGETPMGALDQVGDDVWEQSLAQKLMGYMRFARALTPAMRRARWGRVVNVIGRSGYHPNPGYIVGSTINAALLSFTKALAADCAKDNVLVNGVNPGPIATGRWDAVVAQRIALEGSDRASVLARALAAVPLGRVGQPEEVAQMIAVLCSDRASYVTGALVDVDGGATPCI